MLIYKLTNKLNNKCYIGQTSRSINRRVKEHLYEVNYGSQNAIHRAIRLYGIDNFNIEILEDNVQDKESLSKLEMFYITKYGSFGDNGYNMTDGGEQPPINTKTGSEHPMYGKHHSEETRKKMSESRKGRIHSEETRRKLSISNKGKQSGIKHPMYGKHRPHTEETKQKMRKPKSTTINMLGYRRKGSEHHGFGKPMTEEQKLKISETKKRKNQIIKLTNILNRIVGA